MNKDLYLKKFPGESHFYLSKYGIVKKVFLLWLCVLCAALAKSQTPAIQNFNKYFDLGDAQSSTAHLTAARCLIADSSGIYCFGNTVGQPRIGPNTYGLNLSTGLAKFDYSGNLLWKKYYRSPGNINYIGAWHTVLRKPEGFIVLGVDSDTSIRDSANVFQPFLLYLNKSGDSLRLVKHVDSLHDRTIMCAVQTPDKSILAAGIWGSASRYYSASERRYHPDTVSLYLVKYDSAGNILWQKSYFPARYGTAVPYRIALAADGGILVCGHASAGSLYPSYGHYFAKFDASGNFLWKHRYPYSFPFFTNDDYVDLHPLDDGGYYFTYLANTRSVNDFNRLIAYGRADAQGNAVWLKTHADTLPPPRPAGYPDYFPLVPATMYVDGKKNIYIQGYAIDTPSIVRPTLLVTDSNGRIRSKRAYEPYNYYGYPWMVHTVRSPYNTLVHFGNMKFVDTVAGLIDTVGTYGWIMQTDSFGCMQSGCEIADTVWHYNPTAVIATTDAYEQVVLYPNPASHRVFLEGVPPGSRYDIIDIKGTRAGSGAVAQSRTEINVEAFVPGVYIIRVSVGDKLPVQIRLVKQ